MRLSKDAIKTRYESYDTRVVEFLTNVFEDIKKQNTELNNYFLVSFDLLANQLKMYFLSVDAIDKQKELTSQDNYNRIAKNPAINVMNRAHQEILKILSEFNMSPFGQAKLKRMQKDDDNESAEELLNNLIE